MLKFIRFALYVITFTSILQQPTFTVEQENVRNYLRGWANRCGNVSEVARRIDVDRGTLDRFIKTASTSSSPTVLSKFQIFLSLQTTIPIFQPVQTVTIPLFQNVPQSQIQTTPPISIPFSPSEYQMPLVVVMPHSGPVSIKTPPLSSFEQQLVSSAICSIQGLLPIFLPKLTINQIYPFRMKRLDLS